MPIRRWEDGSKVLHIKKKETFYIGIIQAAKIAQSLPPYPSRPLGGAERALCQCAQDKSPSQQASGVPGEDGSQGPPTALLSSGHWEESRPPVRESRVRAACHGRTLSSLPWGHPRPRTEPPEGQEALPPCPLPAAPEPPVAVFTATAPGCTSGQHAGNQTCCVTRREWNLGTVGC